jgi:Flp pilus assembly protein TadG
MKSGAEFKMVVSSRYNLSSFFTSTCGSVGLSMALALPVMVLAVGVAVDTARIAQTRSAMQSMVDNAALAAAEEFKLSSSDDRHLAQVSEDFIRAGMKNNPIGGVVLQAVEATGDKSQSTLSIAVTVEQTNYFGGFLNPAAVDHHIQTKVQVFSGSKICVLALERSVGDAVNLTDSAKIDAQSCSVQANSTSSSAITVWNKAHVDAEVTCSSGGVRTAPGAIRPAPVTDCPIVTDPLAARAAPKKAADSCDHNRFKVNAEKKTVSPGVYCGGIDISEGAEVQFDPGVYIIKGGVLQASNGSKITGENVGFYFSDGAVFKFNTESSVSLSGRETGEMSGLLFFADRSSAPRIHQVNSRHANKLVGTIYMPNDTFQVATDAAVADDSAYTAIVARKVMLNQSPNLVLKTDYDRSSVPVPDGIRTSVGAVIIK